MTFLYAEPAELQKWYYEAVNYVDPQGPELPYFFGPLFQVTQRVIFVADDHGETVGFASTTPKLLKYCKPTLLAVYVLPARRGEGFGRTVALEALKHLFQTAGSLTVVLEIETPEGEKLVRSLPAEVITKLELHDPAGKPFTLDP